MRLNLGATDLRSVQLSGGVSGRDFTDPHAWSCGSGGHELNDATCGLVIADMQLFHRNGLQMHVGRLQSLWSLEVGTL